MLWPVAGRRRPRNLDAARRVAEVRRAHPESEAWLGLLAAALDESERGVSWDAAVPRPAADRPVRAPLLFGAELSVHRRTARRWVRRIGARVDPRALLEAAVCQDDARIDALAAETGGEPAALRVVGQMAVLPLLQACGRAFAGDLSPTWWEGYCPICGAWPVLAESVGLGRKRQLRCGRCGIGWTIPQLRCVFCDETDHEQLGYLAPEDRDAGRTIEVCKTCRGYLKGLTTVRPLAPWDILLDDLTSVHLDVVALERGYQRPERPGYALEARVV